LAGDQGATDAATAAAYARGAAAAIAAGLGMPLDDARGAAAAVAAGLGMPLDVASLPGALLTALGTLPRGPAPGLAVGSRVGAPPAAPFPTPPSLPVMHRPDSTLIVALITARAAAAEGRTRVREAAFAWKRECDAADSLA